MEKLLNYSLAVTAVIVAIGLFTFETDRSSQTLMHEPALLDERSSKESNEIPNVLEEEPEALDRSPPPSPSLAERFYLSDYLYYDKETLAAIAATGDLVAIELASIRPDYFSLEEREKYALAAARQGELSGLIRLYFDYADGDAAKAYGYLMAAQQLDAPLVEKVDFSGLASLSDEEFEEATALADELVADLGAGVSQ